MESTVCAISSAVRVARPLEQHVLDEMSDAALLLGFVARSASEPDADADRADVRHPLGEESETIREHVADDCWL